MKLPNSPENPTALYDAGCGVAGGSPASPIRVLSLAIIVVTAGLVITGSLKLPSAGVIAVVALTASILFALLPFSGSRHRARWAVALFVIVGIIGVMLTGTRLLMLAHWIVPSEAAAGSISQMRGFFDGVALGAILALILSGELLGSVCFKGQGNDLVTKSVKARA